MSKLQTFGRNFAQEALAKKPDENACISPMGITLSLCLIFQICSAENKQKIAQLLGMNLEEVASLRTYLLGKFETLSDGEGIDLKSADAILTSLDIKNLSLLEQSGISLLPQDQGIFDARLKKHTNGKITTMQLDHDSPLTLANALFFSGAWQETFKLMATKTLFTNSKGEQKEYTMMQTKNYQIANLEDGSQVIKIPYRSGFHALVVIPAIGKTPNQVPLGDLTRYTFRSGDEILRMPRFNLEAYNNKLNNVLDNMGCKGLDVCGLPVHNIEQKIALKTNEEGSTAAAATVVSSRGLMRFITVDRPFGFCIYGNDGTPYFVSQVTDPQYPEEDTTKNRPNIEIN